MNDNGIAMRDLEQEIMEIFSRSLHQELASTEVDLIESGLMDSIVLMELTLALEQYYGLNIPVRDIQIEDLESVKTIANMVLRLMNLKYLTVPDKN